MKVNPLDDWLSFGHHTLEFLHHFAVFFLLPIVTILFSALVAAALTKQIYGTYFGRYATPKELLDEAIGILKKDGFIASAAATDGRGVIDVGGHKPARRLFGSSSSRNFSRSAISDLKQVVFFNQTSSSLHRNRALETLRLVIQLQPNLLQAYVVLAMELLYGEINDPSSGDGVNARDKQKHGKQRQQQQPKQMKVLQNPNEAGNGDNSLRQRNINNNAEVSNPHILQTQKPKAKNRHDTLVVKHVSPALLECLEVIHQGLKIDPKHDALIKLNSELQLVIQYGRKGAHVKMMTVGSFGYGWMEGY